MIIGISGKIASGKNTVADMLSYILFRGQSNSDFKKFKSVQSFRDKYYNLGEYTQSENQLPNIRAFADSLKECLSSILGEPRNKFENREFKASIIKEYNMTVRESLQKVASIFCENIDEKFWIKSLFRRLEKENLSDIIISDVRYPSEVEAIKSRGGLVIRVIRPNLDYYSHPSETSLDDYKNFDYIINNDKDLNNLFKIVLEISKSIKNKL